MQPHTVIDVKKTGRFEDEEALFSPFGSASREELAQQRLFVNADLEALEGLLHACPVRDVKSGEILLSPGQSNQNLYLLLSGCLRVHVDSVKNEPVCILDVGESVGELSAIDRKPAPAFVVADVDSRALVVDQDIFWALINASHAVACNMLQILSDRLRMSNAVISKNRRLQQLYRRHAVTDQLTGLHNRRWLENMLSRQLKRSSINNKALSLVMIDIDAFKQFNNRFGHLAGDYALHALAQTLRDSVRPTDMLARFGGGKFMVILPDTDIERAELVAERIRRNVAEATIMMSDESLLPPLTVSLGIAEMKSSDNYETLVSMTDAALCRAKEKGRNCVSV